MENFLFKLRSGGAIVSSNECSEIEISNARVTDRFFVDNDGYGYVWRTPEWLKTREDFYLENFHASSSDRQLLISE